MTIPPITECIECEEDIETVYDHTPDCEAGKKIAERKINRLEQKLGTAWEIERDRERLKKLNSFIGDTQTDE